MKNQTLRNKIEQLFGLPVMRMPWPLYFAQLNESGKITAKSLLDMMMIVIQTLEENETRYFDSLEKQPASEITGGMGDIDGDFEIKIPDIGPTKFVANGGSGGSDPVKLKKQVKDSKLPKELQ